MELLLEQVIDNDGEEQRIVLIKGEIEGERDAVAAFDAIKGFDLMVEGAAYFADNDHIHLEINGDDIGYVELVDWKDLVRFLGGNI